MSKHHHTRLLAVTGALALVIATTAAVSARGPRDDDRGRWFGPDQPPMGAMRDDMGLRARLHAGISGEIEDFERREVILQTADGVTAQRLEQGIVESADAASLVFSLASGERVTVALDDETEVIAVSEQTVERGRWSRQRLVPEMMEIADLEAGDGVLVWSGSEDGAAFVAERVVIQPPTDGEAEAVDDESATDDAGDTTATDEGTGETLEGTAAGDA